jgi:hypothetical protein
MARVFFHDATPPVTGSLCMWQFIAALIAAGWTKVADSDGTTYSSSGAAVSSGAAGAGGLANTNAWVRMRSPDGLMEYVIQRGTTNLTWRFLRACSQDGIAGLYFTGGTPGATRVPTATNQHLLYGSGTDASPGFGNFFTTDNTYRFLGWVNNAAPYDFLFCAQPLGGGAAAANVPGPLFCLDPVAEGDTGDRDPYVTHVWGTGQSQLQSTQMSSESPAATTFGMWGSIISATPGANFVGWQVPSMYLPSIGSALWPGAGSTQPITGAHPGIPIWYQRRGAIATPGIKGRSTLFRWNTVAKNTPDVLTVSTTRDRICLGHVNTFWDGTVAAF